MSLFRVMIKKFALYRLFPVRHRHILTRDNRPRLRYIAACLTVILLLSTGLPNSILGSLTNYGDNTRSPLVVAGNSRGIDSIPENGGRLPSLNEQNGDFKDGLASVSDYFSKLSFLHSKKLDSELNHDGNEKGIKLANGSTKNFDNEADSQADSQSDYKNSGDKTVGLASAKSDNLLVSDDSINPAAVQPMQPKEEIIKIGSGETVAGVLQEAGISGSEAYNAVKALSKHFNLRDVRAGQAISVRMEPGQNGFQLASLNMKIDPVKEIVVKRTMGDGFESQIKENKVYLDVNAAKATIKNSLYGAAAHAGIPASIVAEMIRIYSYQVDFQRDIRQGDKFEVLYETYETENGDFARYGNVLYANLVVGGKNIPVYRFKTKDGRVDYYGEDGMSIKKTLMKTPVDGARISSGFGMRRHPVSGYTKMHKGIDFAVALGTPIYAAGDGTVGYAGRRGSYGNFVKIRHNGKLETAYAHMHKIAKGISKGTRVRQGQIIGYVGTTGRSTGPHLHYEVILNKKPVNPNSINLPIGQRLAKADMKRFKSHIAAVKQQYAALTEGLKYAQNTVAR